jgi:hypothetical protein
MPSRSLDAVVSEFISELARQIAQAVRAELATEPRRNQGGDGAKKELSRPVARAGGKAGNSSARNIPPHCVYPDCTNAHKGPRFSFLCAEHVGVPKADKKKHLADWKAGSQGRAAVKPTATSKAARGTKGRRSGRPGALDDATLSQVFKVVEDNPGLRSEEIYKKLSLAPQLAKKALAKLRAQKRVKTKGAKRATTYAAA